MMRELMLTTLVLGISLVLFVTVIQHWERKCGPEAVPVRVPASLPWVVHCVKKEALK